MTWFYQESLQPDLETNRNHKQAAGRRTSRCSLFFSLFKLPKIPEYSVYFHHLYCVLSRVCSTSVFQAGLSYKTKQNSNTSFQTGAPNLWGVLQNSASTTFQCITSTFSAVSDSHRLSWITVCPAFKIKVILRTLYFDTHITGQARLRFMHRQSRITQWNENMLNTWVLQRFICQGYGYRSWQHPAIFYLLWWILTLFFLIVLFFFKSACCLNECLFLYKKMSEEWGGELLGRIHSEIVNNYIRIGVWKVIIARVGNCSHNWTLLF